MSAKKKPSKAAAKAKPARTAGTAGQQALLLVLGSAPAMATFESLLAAAEENSILYHNAVSNQQKTNMLGMVATAKAVQILLDPPDAKAKKKKRSKR